MTSALRLDRSLLWKISGDEDLIWHCWDGDFVVYHPLSGDTQLLDVSTAEILKQISDSPKNHVDLCAQLAAFLEVENDSELAKAVTQIIGRLNDLGIVESMEE